MSKGGSGAGGKGGVGGKGSSRSSVSPVRHSTYGTHRFHLYRRLEVGRAVSNSGGGNPPLDVARALAKKKKK